MSSEKIILVPTDFTAVADVAMQHAITIADAIGANIYVLHVVGNKSMAEDGKMKLEALKSRLAEESGVDVHVNLRIGNIFEDIDEYSVEIGAGLIIMGTHGARGMQFLNGTRALRVVTESSIPFIVVQEGDNIKESGYDKIVVPLDLHKETKQKLAVAGDIAKYFDSKVYLVSPNEKDEFLKNQLERNLNYGQQYFADRNIPCEAKVLRAKSSGFVKDLLGYAEDIEADMICIMNFSENSLFSFFGGNYEQQVITNRAKIPVLCLNPVDRYKSDQNILMT